MSKLACLTAGKDRAFPAFPRVDRYFPASAIEEARQRLARSIDRADGPALVIGPTGTGKTLVLQLLATQFAQRFNIAFLTSTANCTRRGLLQSILFELRQPYRDREASELRLGLVEQLLDRESSPNGLLLLVDEAQLLSTRLLEELRALGNLACGGEPRVRIVLGGSLQLDETFTSPELEIFNQRLAARCYLAPLNHRELVQYVRAQVAAAGAKPDELFLTDALDAVYHATDGIPRLVNQLCDRAIVMAVDRRLQRIDRSLIEAAWADLQQLPTPWIVSSEAASSHSGSIEFGSLDDEDSSLVDEGTQLDEEEVEYVISKSESGCTPNLQTEVMIDSEDLELEPEIVCSPATRQRVDDPFAESFQEEELLLDRFASLESAFQPSTPRVRNRRESFWSQMLQDADFEVKSDSNSEKTNSASGSHEIEVLPDSESVEMVENYFDEPLIPQFSTLFSPPSKAAISSPYQKWPSSASEYDVLEIEEEAPAPVLKNPQVQRREFRQLFASLRGD